MNEPDWTTIRDDATHEYGDVPGAELERRILVVFQHRPSVVLDGIDRIGRRYKAGEVRSFWAVLALDVEEKAGRGEAHHALPSGDREKKIARAEQWMRAAGIHFDQPEEILDELFGDRGMLRAWKDDTFLQQRMYSLWVELRPIGEGLEADMLERAKRWRDGPGRVWQARNQPKPVSASSDNPFL